MTGCPPTVQRSYASPPPSGSAASLLLSDYRGVPHHPYRATGATAPAASAEVGRAVVIAQPSEIVSARAQLRSVLSAVCLGIGAR